MLINMQHINSLLWRKIKIIGWLTLLMVLGSAGDVQRVITVSIAINYSMPAIVTMGYIITFKNRKFIA